MSHQGASCNGSVRRQQRQQQLQLRLRHVGRQNDDAGGNENGGSTVRAIAALLLSCCVNVLTYEAVLRYDKSLGQLVSLLQFAFLVCASAPGACASVRARRRLARWSGGGGRSAAAAAGVAGASLSRLRARLRFALRLAAYVVTFFFSVSLTNFAAQLGVGVPLIVLFRSASLVAALPLSFVVERRRHTPAQVASVLLLAAGIAWSTALTRRQQQLQQQQQRELEQAAATWDARAHAAWTLGVVLLGVNAFLGPLLGIQQGRLLQQRARKRDTAGRARPGGMRREELVFAQHLLAMPLFFGGALLGGKRRDDGYLGDLRRLASASLPVSSIGAVPRVPGHVLLAVNLLTQHACVHAVMRLQQASGSALAVQVATTVRKFFSLVLSVLLFREPFDARNWAAACLVFGGSIGYPLCTGGALSSWSSLSLSSAAAAETARASKASSKVE